MINEALDAIEQRIAHWFAPLLDWLFVAEWWGLLLAFLILCLVIGYFAQFSYVRAALGFLVLLAGAFVAGGTEMFRHIRNERRPK